MQSISIEVVPVVREYQTTRNEGEATYYNNAFYGGYYVPKSTINDIINKYPTFNSIELIGGLDTPTINETFSTYIYAVVSPYDFDISNSTFDEFVSKLNDYNKTSITMNNINLNNTQFTIPFNLNLITDKNILLNYNNFYLYFVVENEAYFDTLDNLPNLKMNNYLSFGELSTISNDYQDKVSAFNDGFNKGVASVNQNVIFEEGYTQGYNKGITEDYSLSKDLLGVADIPIQTFKDIFSFEVLGFNFAKVTMGLLTLGICIYLIKKFF